MFYKRNEITREKEEIMGIRTRLAVLACKTSNAVLRRMGRGGTNLPGKIALKIDKDILKELSRGVKVTVVTGTNGKTTTSRMIEQAFEEAGYKYFANKSGANLLTGIITVFAAFAPGRVSSGNVRATAKRKVLPCFNRLFIIASCPP